MTDAHRGLTDCSANGSCKIHQVCVHSKNARILHCTLHSSAQQPLNPLQFNTGDGRFLPSAACISVNFMAGIEVSNYFLTTSLMLYVNKLYTGFIMKTRALNNIKQQTECSNIVALQNTTKESMKSVECKCTNVHVVRINKLLSHHLCTRYITEPVFEIELF